MSEDVKLPALGESVTEGTVTRWLKGVGDTVEVDEPLLEVSTDKVDTEVPSPVAGVLQEILVAEDETAEVGAVLARIGDGAAAPAAEAPAPAAEEPAQEQPAAAETAPAAQAQEPAPAAEAAPAAGQASAGEGEDVVLPALGESVTEGTVTRWLKGVGDTVEVDEPLLEVSTDKVDTEVPSPVAGVLQEILVAEDETAEVGAVLARIGDGAAAPAAEAPAPAAEEPAAAKTAPAAQEPAPEAHPQADQPQPPAPQESAAAPETVTVAAPAAPAAQPVADASRQRYVTPIVRRLANRLGVDLAGVQGTGVGGRIRKSDVEAAAAAAPAAGASASGAPAAKPGFEVSELRGTRAKMSRLRKVIAERAVQSLGATAQLTTVVEVDVTAVARLRERVKQEFLDRTGNKLSFLPFFVLAAVEALQSHPIVNATVEGDEIVYPGHENISMAVDTPRGLLTPVVKDAAGMNLAQLASQIADLAARTRDNKLTPDELAGGTFTVTNTGSRGALFDTPLVFLPQSAILGTGAVVKRPAVVRTADGEESLAIRSFVYLALSYDHRIIDGADAARFLAQVKGRLEDGAFEQDLGI
ncbi:MAG: 2-oxoglutarate dehydrogenase, E2 component, dihydrolipoamide succinyltransferase [Pseudoclavibacter sp.]|nr:2-oxoglutarate dehydrogenase, E2 component, dihydrolipoamide succinyltransferase [Pseudoclavibacter sp.]